MNYQMGGNQIILRLIVIHSSFERVCVCVCVVLPILGIPLRGPYQTSCRPDLHRYIFDQCHRSHDNNREKMELNNIVFLLEFCFTSVAGTFYLTEMKN